MFQFKLLIYITMFKKKRTFLPNLGIRDPSPPPPPLKFWKSTNFLGKGVISSWILTLGSTNPGHNSSTLFSCFFNMTFGAKTKTLYNVWIWLGSTWPDVTYWHLKLKFSVSTFEENLTTICFGKWKNSYQYVIVWIHKIK